MDRQSQLSGASFAPDKPEDQWRLGSDSACKSCAHVVDRLTKVEYNIRDYDSKMNRVNADIELDRIDLGTPAEFEGRSSCSTCHDLSWYFKPTKEMKDDVIDAALSHLIIQIKLDYDTKRNKLDSSMSLVRATRRSFLIIL